jgi:hypothetical protein
MKCSNCGMDNIVEDAVHCPNCGASLITPGNWDARQAPPQQQYQQPPVQGPQPQYQQPPGQYQQPPQQYSPPRPPKAARVATVRNIGLTEILSLFSGLFLVIVGFDNLSAIKTSGYGGQVFVLGVLALLIGLAILAMVIMPYMMKGMNNSMMDIAMLVLSLIFVIYGFVLVFSTYTRISGFLGFDGAILIAAGLSGLAASGLKMGILK